MFLYKFTAEGFHQRIIRWMISSDQPFTAVENAEFRELMTYVRPSAAGLLLGADAYRNRIMAFSEEAKQKLAQRLMVRTGD
jgi:hypothetical protein